MKKILLLVFVMTFIFFPGCDTAELNDDSTDPTNQPEGPTGIFTITDNPVDKLSVLEVELTELKIVDTSGTETVVFSQQEGDETFILNLLNLDGVTNLLGTVPLAAGTYKEILLTFQNASALDLSGNVLDVVPKRDDTITVKLDPHIVVAAENVLVEIDFDVENSVYNVVSGRNGRVELHPNIVVSLDPTPDGEEPGDSEIDDIKGTIKTLGAMSMVVTLNNGDVNVSVNDETIIEIDEVITTPPQIGNDLTTVFAVGENVEVDGPFNAGTNTVNATKVERKWGSSKGKEFQGVILDVDSSSFEVLVLDVDDSGFTAGSTQTVNFDGNTLFLFTDPSEVANSDHLSPGQDVRVTGDLANQFLATRVKLRETKIQGTVHSLGPKSNQLSIDVEKIERLVESTVSGFKNPLLVEINTNDALNVGIGAKIEVEGQFNRAGNGVFLVIEWEAEEVEEEEVEVKGKTFSVVSTSPLVIDLTGEFDDLGMQGTSTIQVKLDSGAKIIENQKGTKTQISQQDLINGIDGNRYEEMEAEGFFDEDTNTLTAKKIKVEVKEEEEDDD